MIGSILFSLWFFLPAGIANMAPVFVMQLPVLKKWNTPLDGGLTLGKKRLFGPHKTMRGLISGILLSILIVWLQRYVFGWYPQLFGWSEVDYRNINVLLLGFLLGFGALSGDVLKSLIKRQVGIASGDSFFPFDQVDYILGAIIATLFLVRLPFVLYLFTILLWIGLHLLVSYIGFLLKLKPKPI